MRFFKWMPRRSQCRHAQTKIERVVALLQEVLKSDELLAPLASKAAGKVNFHNSTISVNVEEMRFNVSVHEQPTWIHCLVIVGTSLMHFVVLCTALSTCFDMTNHAEFLWKLQCQLR